MDTHIFMTILYIYIFAEKIPIYKLKRQRGQSGLLFRLTTDRPTNQIAAGRPSSSSRNNNGSCSNSGS